MDKDGNKLTKLAIQILSIIANMAACKHNFSNFSLTHTKICNKLSVERVHNTNVIKNHLHHEHAKAGLTHVHKKCKLGFENHPSSDDTAESVPPHADEDVSFQEVGEGLIWDANTVSEDLGENTTVPIILIPPNSSHSCTTSSRRAHTKIPLQNLFCYPGEDEQGWGSGVGLDFYWKRGLKNMEREVCAYELVYDAETGITLSSAELTTRATGSTSTSM